MNFETATIGVTLPHLHGKAGQALPPVLTVVCGQVHHQHSGLRQRLFHCRYAVYLILYSLPSVTQPLLGKRQAIRVRHKLYQSSQDLAYRIAVLVSVFYRLLSLPALPTLR